MHRIRTISVAIALALLSISARASTGDTVRRTFSVQPGGTLTIDADLGDITVRTAATNQVAVEVVRSGRASDIHDYEITFSQEGNDVRVRGTYEHKWRMFDWNNLEAHYNVTVPSTYNVHLGTSGGDIHIADLHGEVVCKTSGGNLELGNIQGDVDARTSGGNVKLASSTGKAELRTSGGDIKAGEVNGPLTVRTSGGNIDVRRVAGDLVAHTSGGSIDTGDVYGSIDAESSGGSIRASLAKQPRGASRLSTSGGSITLTVASSVGMDLDAHTSGGDVTTDMPVTILGRQSDSTLNGKMNGGGPKLVLRSSGGDIRVRKM
jgi:DUF4097 and DUF4098 domain-containing protein YvlB